MDFEEADLFQKCAALLKVLCRLAGEAADAVSGKADRAAAVGGADLLHHLCVLLRGVHPAHPAQGGGAAALQTQVELGAKLVHRRQAGDEFRGEHIGVKAAQTDALDARHLCALFHQLHKVRAGVQPVAGQGDGAEHHLAVARSGQLVQLGQNALLGAAAHRPAGAGDDAVGALPVAAVLYLDKGAGVGLEPFHRQLLELLAALVRGNGYDALVAVQQLLYVLQNGLAVAVAAHKVGFHELCGLLREGLRVAAGQHRHRTGVFALFAAQPLAALLVAEVGHGAAVHNEHVRCLAFLRNGKAVGAEQLFQRAGLVQVDLAAEGIKTNSHGERSFR